MFFQIIFLFALLLLIFLWSLKHQFRMPDNGLILPLIANSTILALASGSFLWQLECNNPEVFTDFIGGFLAMASMGKTFEYHAFYLGIVVFVTSFGLLGKIYSSFKLSLFLI